MTAKLKFQEGDRVKVKERYKRTSVGKVQINVGESGRRGKVVEVDPQGMRGPEYLVQLGKGEKLWYTARDLEAVEVQCSRCKVAKLKTGSCYTCPNCGN